jgi:hypothetical protein
MLHGFHRDGLLNEELLFLGFLHYDLRDPHLVLYDRRRDHGGQHYLHPLMHHAVDGERHLVVLDDGDNTVRFRVHYDHLGGDDA